MQVATTMLNRFETYCTFHHTVSHERMNNNKLESTIGSLNCSKLLKTDVNNPGEGYSMSVWFRLQHAIARADWRDGGGHLE